MGSYIRIPVNLFETMRILLSDDRESDLITVFWLRLFAKCKSRTKDGWPIMKITGIEMSDRNIQIMLRMEHSSLSVTSSMIKLISAGLVKRDSKKIIIMPPWLKNRDRNTDAYKRWRLGVMNRDGFKCANCGSKKQLVAHHIVHWSDTEADSPLRFDKSNGITLCHKCHFEAHGGSWR